MAFCQNCGNKLEDGAKFCASCGTPSGATGSEGVRKQSFVGDIKKCPSCGAEVPSMTAICPECGHEMSNTKVSDVLKEFQAGLVKYEGEEERDFVASFPIPNTKEDLGNFLSMVASILLTDLQNGSDTERVTSFTSKFQEIMNKVEILLPEDDPIQKQAKKWEEKISAQRVKYDKLLEDAKKELKVSQKFRKRHPIIWGILMFYLGCFILSIIVSIIMAICGQ